ncbi:hypothetical protein FRC03_003521 [Tulasnella sp. 419]|nr:hypothetical protein FRC03_003521 [Tulasnella sp. 419]
MSDYMSEDSDQEYLYDEEDDDQMQSDQGSTPGSEEEESDDDAGFGMDMSVTTGAGKSKRKAYEIDYENLANEDIQKSMAKEAELLSSMLEVDISTASMLLRHMQWNREKLIDKFMEDPEGVLEKAGISTTNAPTTTPAAPVPVASSSSGPRKLTRKATKEAALPPPPAPEAFMCPICCCEPSEPSAIFSLSCGHVFCTDCWSTYLSGKIREEGEHSIRCMESGCNQQVADKFILGNKPSLLDEETKKKFTDVLVRYYVQCQSSLRYCPAPGCHYTVQCPGATKSGWETVVPTVTCGDNHDFCFGCGEDGDHRPLICRISRMWLKKCQDDSETANWIKSNTKECPKCQSTIEKNGGCNHMTCKKCKNEFCWVCMGPWSEHGNAWYSCNRYEEKEGVEARDAQSRSRASLERYLHYYNRWANHEQSARLSLDLYAKTEKKMEEMQVTSNLTWIEVQFAKKAVDEVIKCRRTLKWTYAMGYYLEKGNQKELFEDNQRDLEKAVEALSELLERPIEPETIGQLRQQVTDKTVYVLKRNEVMLEDTANGYLEGRWQWITDTNVFKLDNQ